MNDVEGVHRVKIPGGWLDKNGELFVCAVQPEPPSSFRVLKEDASRPGALALAERLSDERIRYWKVGRPALIVFPELAFGSVDFEALDTWVAELPSPTIVLAGFGFCSGRRLLELLARRERRLEPTWPQEVGPIDPEGTYNGGWCWIHRPGERLRRLVYLKNFAEQKVEVAWVEGWTPGSHILRLETDDLILFPLICADLIDNRPASPRHRVRASLNDVKGCNKRILIAGLLYSEKTHSDFWKTSLNYLAVNERDARVAMFLVNLSQPQPQVAEKEDSWRSLTGAFLHRGRIAGPPSQPLPHVRYVATDDTRGLVLRLTRPGTADGTLRWQCSADLGGAVWNPIQRRVWESDERLNKVGGWVISSELRRFVARKKDLPGRPHESLRPILSARFERLGHLLEKDLAADWINNLWPRLLYGLQPVSKKDSNPDLLHSHGCEEALLRALIVLAVLNSDGLARLLLEAADEAQLFLEFRTGYELLIWHSPLHSCRHQIRHLQQLTEETGRPRLLVIGAGSRGHSAAQKIRRGRYRDATTATERRREASDRRRDIREPRSLRPVYWLPLGEFENVLDREEWGPDDVGAELDRRLRGLIESLLEGIAA